MTTSDCEIHTSHSRLLRWSRISRANSKFLISPHLRRNSKTFWRTGTNFTGSEKLIALVSLLVFAKRLWRMWLDFGIRLVIYQMSYHLWEAHYSRNIWQWLVLDWMSVCNKRCGMDSKTRMYVWTYLVDTCTRFPYTCEPRDTGHHRKFWVKFEIYNSSSSGITPPRSVIIDTAPTYSTRFEFHTVHAS